MKPPGTLLFVCLSWLCMHGQTIDFATEVSFNYEDEELGTVIADLSNRYGVRFSYSRQVVPMDYGISAKAHDVSFKEALSELFDPTPIVYGFIGGQIVLSVDVEMLREARMLEVLGDDSMAEVNAFPGNTRTSIPRIQPVPGISKQGKLSYELVDPDALDEQFVLAEKNRVLETTEWEEDNFRAQVTLFPPMQAISHPESDEPVNLSLNVFWGINESIDGVEWGFFANSVRGNVRGFQGAGLYNEVQKSAEGFQLAGFVNNVKDTVSGFQLAGLVNRSGKGGDAFQAAGLVNTARRNVYGQFSGLVSVADEVEFTQVSVLVSAADNAPSQISGLVSATTETKAQISGLTSVADRSAAQISGLSNISEHAGTQIGALVNVARTARTQIGLINIADSAHTAIGLFSLVKNGYKAAELSGEESIHLNANFRFGTRSFYNILHLGTTFDVTSWSLGYGIGFSTPVGKKSFTQFELMTRHVNDDEGWTNEVNFLNQLKLNWDINLGNNTSIAFGPTLNVMTSKRYDSDTDSYGSDIPLYDFYEETFADRPKGPLNVKAWVGFNVGIRFGTRDYPRTPPMFID